MGLGWEWDLTNGIGIAWGVQESICAGANIKNQQSLIRLQPSK